METATVAILGVRELRRPETPARLEIVLPRPDGAVCKVIVFRSLLGDYEPTVGDEVTAEFIPGEDGRLWLGDVRRDGRSLVYVGGTGDC